MSTRQERWDYHDQGKPETKQQPLKADWKDVSMTVIKPGNISA